MEYGQRLRGTLLRPLLVWLTRLHVSPDAVTLVAALFGLAFVPLWLMGYKLLALLGLTMHVCLDGLDGPLARHQQRASSQGSFTDTFADQIVVTGVTIAWMMDQPAMSHIFVGGAYIFLYALVVAMAMARNALNAPYSWLVRPRFFVFVALAIDYGVQAGVALVVMAICNLLLLLKAISGFQKLRERLPGPKQEDAE